MSALNVETNSLAKGAILCSDGGRCLSVPGSPTRHPRPVNLAVGIRVITGVYRIQNVNAYNQSPQTVDATLLWCSEKYLEII